LKNFAALVNQGVAFIPQNLIQKYTLNTRIMQIDFQTDVNAIREFLDLIKTLKVLNSEALRGMIYDFNLFNFKSKNWKNVKILFEYNSRGASINPKLIITDFCLNVYDFGIEYKIVDIVRLIIYIVMVIVIPAQILRHPGKKSDSSVVIKQDMIIVLIHDLFLSLLIPALGIASVLIRIIVLNKNFETLLPLVTNSQLTNLNFFSQFDVIESGKYFYLTTIKLQSIEICLLLWFTLYNLKKLNNRIDDLIGFIFLSFSKFFLVFSVIIFLIIPISFMCLALFGRVDFEYYDFWNCFFRVVFSIFGKFVYPIEYIDDGEVIFLNLLIYFIFCIFLIGLIIVYASEEQRVKILLYGNLSNQKFVTNESNEHKKKARK
jgi:hypothetical protein